MDKYLGNKLFFLKLAISLALIVLVASSCRPVRNNWITRSYHAVTARWNVHFNGWEALEMADDILELEHRYDFNGILPVFLFTEPTAPTEVASLIDRAIIKAIGTIDKHSIKAKPKKRTARNAKKRRKENERKKEFYGKSEYNVMTDNAYLLLGRAHSYKHEYASAAEAFEKSMSLTSNDNQRLYSALLYIIANIELDKMSLAENTLLMIKNIDKYPKRLRLLYNKLWTHFYIKKDVPREAIPYITEAIKLTHKTQDKIRLRYIAGQLYGVISRKESADDQYKKILRSNPTFDFEFNSRLKLLRATEKEDYDKNKKILLRYTRQTKNIDNLDQIYYNLGNMDIQRKKTKSALDYYNLSIRSSTGNDNQLSIGYLALANYYFVNGDHIKSYNYYDSCLVYYNINREGYDGIYNRYISLSNVVKKLETLKISDSLLKLSLLPATEQKNVMNAEIERQKAVAESLKAEQGDEDGNGNFFKEVRLSDRAMGATGQWYFYNVTQVKQGQAEFKQRWGTRKLEDNWRRRNKSIQFNEASPEADSIAEKKKEATIEISSLEDLLSAIPKNEEEKAALSLIIEDNLFYIGDEYDKVLNNQDRAIYYYTELLKRFPKTRHRSDALFALYKLYDVSGDLDLTEKFKGMFLKEFPEENRAKVIKDPSYERELRRNDAREETAYQDLYDLTNKKKYSEMLRKTEAYKEKVTFSRLLPKLELLRGICFMGLGQLDKAKEVFISIATIYIETDEANAARDYLDRIKQ